VFFSSHSRIKLVECGMLTRLIQEYYVTRSISNCEFILIIINLSVLSKIAVILTENSDKGREESTPLNYGQFIRLSNAVTD
jgi:hypothetical protein